MFSIQDRPTRLCDGMTRREWLRVGGSSLFGLSLSELLGESRAAGARSDKAKACIVLYLGGGPPQHETWDPKPDAPAEIRGDLKPIASSVPGLFVGELMPRVARLAHKVCVLRAVYTNDHAHSSSLYWTLTGSAHAPTNTELTKPGAPNDMPCLGAVVGHLRGGRGTLPASITLPEHFIGNNLVVPPGQNAGFLGRRADPWLITCDPSAPNFQMSAVDAAADVPALRLDDRRSLLDQVNRHFDAGARGNSPALHDAQTQQAFDLLRSTKARRAFDLSAEPVGVRDRYGRHKFGQSVLLARRLIEAGVAVVQVNWPREKGDMQAGNPLWDTHSKNTERLKTALMPPMDQAYSALLEDLDQRGMLNDTLIVWMGEFGRTPKINGSAGRDHWGGVFSVALAGGGVQGGRVIGASDRIGASPKDGGVEPQHLTATIYHALGLRHDAEVRDTLGRPIPISRGEVIRQVF
ncbi:MAG: DUF1501 domain-containing protein [Gemmataceae bacterium]|nr:DUF1501 domain-containing protein [Gemmataceae bacterium]